MDPEEEEKLLRSVALQNAKSILRARLRAEEELAQAKESLERKTEELAHSLAMTNATLEATTDGILATDDAGKVTGFNQRYVNMWRMPRAIMDSRDHQQLLEFNGKQFENPRQYVEKIEEIYRTSPPESFDLLELIDGRTFERFSRIQFVNERNAGRVWSFRDITERRLAEEALRKQSEWLQVTLSSIGDAVITTDTEGRVTSLNPVAESLTGWTDRMAKGLPIDRVFQIVNEHSRAVVENPTARALQEGVIVGLANHTILISAHGAERFIDDSAAPIRDGNGRVIGAVLVFRDVTERRRAEEARFHLAAVVDSSNDAIVSKNLDGIIRSWNAGAERIFGYSAEEIVGKSITILLPVERLHEEAEILRRLRQGERVEHFDTVRRRKDGRLIDVSITVSPIRDSTGKVVGASKIARDISARKRVEQVTRFLAETNAALAELTDYESTLQKVASLSVPSFADWCAVDMIDADGSVRRLAVMHGDATKVYSSDVLPRQFPPLSSDPFGIRNVLRTSKPEWAAEIPETFLSTLPRDQEHLDPLRKLGLKSYICVPLLSRTKAVGALTFVTAESGRTYGADDLQAAVDLAHRAVIAIENANLVSALKESDRRKDEFLAMLAHELRNPLAPIRNGLQILRLKENSGDAIRSASEMMERQVSQMVRLVDDLLDVSRITRGKIELRRDRIELAAAVNQAVEAARSLVQCMEHELTVAHPPEPIYLNADLTRLAQIVGNLLNNACKFTEKGGRISLAVEREGVQAVIRVKDTGVGIAADQLPRIFEMFTQLDTSLERSQNGLGIGLTLVKNLVEMHGGTVDVYSAGLGHGSEFVVRLPVASRERPELGSTPIAHAPGLPATPRRVLVVDDNKDSATSLAMLLTLTGNETRTAYDGLEAVETAATFRPDIVLLDIGLPKLNGYEAARRIREQPWGKDMILVALTGWGQEEDRKKSREAGFNGHLVKPVEYAVLTKLMAELQAAKE